MNTRKILLISKDKELISIINTSCLTFTKLNCQISLESIDDYTLSLERSKAVNLDLIIADKDIKDFDMLSLFREIRKSGDSGNKKIMCLYSEDKEGDRSGLNKEEIFKAGCDSIMSKEEFKRVVNNVLMF